MVQIAGTYEFVSSENYPEYLASFGLAPEQIEKAGKNTSPVVITSADDKQITIQFRGKEKTFVFNQETEHTLPTGHEVMTTTLIDGDTVTFKSKSKDGSLSEDRVFKVTDSGLTSTSTSSKGVVATREYKRT